MFIILSSELLIEKRSIQNYKGTKPTCLHSIVQQVGFCSLVKLIQLHGKCKIQNKLYMLQHATDLKCRLCDSTEYKNQTRWLNTAINCVISFVFLLPTWKRKENCNFSVDLTQPN
jgi:hypothetical protein